MNSLDVIVADKLADNTLSFPDNTTGKIVGYLTNLQIEEPRAWASISTIAAQTGASDMYTRTCLKKLCENKIVETGFQKESKKYFFRLKPTS